MDDFTTKQSCMSIACKSVDGSVEKTENHPVGLSSKKEDFHASNQSLQTKQVNENLQPQSEAESSSSSSSQSNVSYSSSNNATYNNCSNVNGVLSTPGPSGLATQHYYSQILNNPQSLLRPLMTTQPPLYSPILASQQHSYALPHPSPSSGSFPGLTDSIRTLEPSSCSSDALFKEVTHHSRLNGEAISNNDKSCSMQNSLKQYPVDSNSKRTNGQSSCSVNRYPSCAEAAAKLNNGAEQQQIFEEYVRIYGEDVSCRSWGESSSTSSLQNSSSHHRNNSYVTHQPGASLNVHGYSDCRLDPSWNRYISGQSSNCISDSYVADNNSYSKHLIKGYSAVANGGNHSGTTAATEHNLSRSHYEYHQPISAGQLASLLTTYMQPMSYQTSQDCRTDYRTADLRVNENQCEINENSSSSEVAKKQIEMANTETNASVSTTSQVIAVTNTENETSHSIPSSAHISVVSSQIQTTSLATPSTSSYQESQISAAKEIQNVKKVTGPTTSAQPTTSCQTASISTFPIKTDRDSLENFKKQNKIPNAEGSSLSFFCMLCGESVNESPIQSHIDNISTYASKISINEKLALMIGYPLPRDMLPSQSICPKCFRLVNEVDILESRLNACRREVLLQIESMFERNGIHFSPYKRLQRQQYVGSYQHPDMQHTTYQCIGTNVIGSHNGHSSYQNDAQNYQSLNHIYPVHNQGNQMHLMHQSQMHLPQNYHQHNVHLHATLVHTNSGQDQQTHVDENHLNSQHAQMQQHQANQVQEDSLKVHIQPDLSKMSLESNTLKQHQQNQHQIQTEAVQTQPNQQHHQLLNQNENINIIGHQLQSQSNQLQSLSSSINQTHSLNQDASQIQSVSQHQAQQNFSKQHEHLSFHNQTSHIDNGNQYQENSAGSLSQSVLSGQVHGPTITSKSSENHSHQSNQQTLNAYQVSDSTSSNAESSTSSSEHGPSLQSKALPQVLVSAESIQEKEKSKTDLEGQVLIVNSSNQIPIILPETSGNLDSHPMAVLLSYQQPVERSLSSELLGGIDPSYSNITSLDTSVGTDQPDKELEKHPDPVNSSVEKDYAKCQNIDVENWHSCSDSALEKVSKSIPSNHPECDIDIEECDNIIENIPDEQTNSCSSKIFLKAEDNSVIAKQSGADVAYEAEQQTTLCNTSNDNELPSSTSEHNDINDLKYILPPSPPPPPVGPPEGLRNVQDATEYHKPTLLGKNIKVKKHAKLQICRQCDQVFSNRQALIRHIGRRHKNFAQNYSCETCHKKFNSETTLRQHAKTHKTYPCKICSKIFLKKIKLKKHFEEHSQKSLTCKVCGKEATSMPALISHIKTHDRQPKSYICSICSKQFTCKRNLDQHSLIHTGEKPFSCENCGKTFRIRGNMINHFKVCTHKFHYMCSACGKGFVLKCLYERHIAEHKGRYAHCCSVCHKGFSKSSDLRKHFNTHGTPQTYSNSCTVCNVIGLGCNKPKETNSICEICGKHILSKAAMKDHLAFHAGERNYTCQICSVSYYYKTNLTYHTKSVHLKKMPYSCNVCGKAFSKPGNHKLHMRTHTGEKPYQCKSCGKAFSTSSNYKRHLKCHFTHAQADSKSVDESEIF